MTPEDRGRSLYDEGARVLAALWDDAVSMVRGDEEGDHHSPRGTLAYAHVLLRDGDVARAERAIRAVLALQETREQDAHCGNFRWRLEEPVVRDLNGVEFMLDELIPLARDHAASLPAALLDAMRDAIRLGLAEIDRLDVHLSYTNIALSDIANSVLGGELLDEPRSVERGVRRLDEWLAFTNASGAPHEFNSATYAAVDILRMATLAEHTRDRAVALKARVAEERLWLHVAAHYHPRMAQLAGPHARSYFDGWSGGRGYLKMLLWKLLGDDALRRDTPYAPRSREEGHIGVALTTLHCPDHIERWLHEKRYPFEARETTDAASGIDITTYMTEAYALGTASRSFRAGAPPEQWPGFNSLHLYVRRDDAPGYGALYARYLINDKEPGATVGGRFVVEDLWDEGQHVAVQDRNRAILAYAPMPRAKPAHSYKLSLRLLGVSGGDEIWVGDRRADAWPARVAPEERIVVGFGQAYMALIPLRSTDMGSDAPIQLNLSDNTLTLDVYNYRGPAKTFWEYRSQSGAFFKGVVRNAVILEVAGRNDFSDISAFRRHIAGARITDEVDAEHRREITYASDGGSVALAYSLWDMSVLGRRCGDTTYAPRAARAGAIDGGAAQFVVGRSTPLTLGHATLDASGGPAWLFADNTQRRYVAHAFAGEGAMRLRTRETGIVCEARGLMRLDLDEADALLRVDSIGPPSGLRIELGGPLRAVVNGVAVDLRSDA